MKWRVLFLGLALFAFHTATSPNAQAQNVVVDENAPADNVEPDSVIHPFLTVEGVQVFYFYDANGAVRYYYLSPNGERVFYPFGWRPYRITAGTRFFFDPVPYIWVGGRPVFYYQQGDLFRYYVLDGSTIRYYPHAWRPFYLVGGVRTFIRPRYIYRYNTWRTYNVYNRPYYRPNYVRTRYRYNPVRRYRTVYRPTRVYRQPVRVYRQPVRVHSQPVRVQRQPVRTHHGRRRK